MKITLIVIEQSHLLVSHEINLPGTPYIGINWEDEVAKYLSAGDNIHIKHDNLAGGGITLTVHKKGHRFNEGLIIYCFCNQQIYREALKIYRETDHTGNLLPLRS
jgi:hypothetical protein